MDSNLRHADDTTLCKEEAERLIGKVNNTVKERLLKLNVKQSKLLEIGKIQPDAVVIVDDEKMEVVEHFKYLGSLKSADGICSKYTRSRIGMVPIWRDRGMNKTIIITVFLGLLQHG